MAEHPESDHDDSDDSCYGPIIDWDGIVHGPVPRTNTDDQSTVCFYSIGSMDSYPLRTEDGSSHGTVDDFCMQYKCHVCQLVPNTSVALIIEDGWTLEEANRFHINGNILETFVKKQTLCA